MDQKIRERRRLLQFLMLGSMALPAVALAGCAQKPGTRPTKPRRYGGGGSQGGEKSGGRN